MLFTCSIVMSFETIVTALLQQENFTTFNETRAQVAFTAERVCSSVKSAHWLLNGDDNNYTHHSAYKYIYMTQLNRNTTTTTLRII